MYLNLMLQQSRRQIAPIVISEDSEIVLHAPHEGCALPPWHCFYLPTLSVEFVKLWQRPGKNNIQHRNFKFTVSSTNGQVNNQNKQRRFLCLQSCLVWPFHFPLLSPMECSLCNGACKEMTLPCLNNDPPLEEEVINGSETLSCFCFETKLQSLQNWNTWLIWTCRFKISMMLIPTDVIDPSVNKKAWLVD